MAAPNTPILSIGENIEGSFFTFSLVGRGLPYRPIAIGGKQRVEFTWYPGSPNATTQMLGPEESPITIRGFWKDAYLPTSGTAVSSADNTDTSPSVATLVKFVDTMRRRGQVCTFEWDNIRRIGHITEFVQTWHNIHDCEWELTFTPLGQDDATTGTVVTPATVTPAGVLGSFTQTLLNVNTVLGDGSSAIKAGLGFQWLNDIDVALYTTQQTFAAATNVLYTTVTSATSLVLRPTEAANRMMTSMSQSIVSLKNTSATVATRSVDALFNFRNAGGGLNSVPLAKQVTAYQWQRTTKETFRAGAEALSGRFFETKEALQQELLAVYTATEGIDLSSVSTKYYSKPDYWRQLMNYNGLKESRLDIGQVVLVPKLTELDPNVLPTNGGY